MLKQQYFKAKKCTEEVKKIFISFFKGNKGQTMIIETIVVSIIVLVVLVVVFWPQVSAISTNLFSRMSDYIGSQISQITS